MDPKEKERMNKLSPGLGDQIDAAERSKENCRDKIKGIFEEVGVHYQERGLVELDLRQDQDVHAFFRLTGDPSKAIHVQGYPGISSDEQMRVWARLMDYDKMMEIRSRGTVSPGNEHEATIQGFPNLEHDTFIPYDSKVLEGMLAENVPELK
ncbi:MAG: hypothetical protein KAT77_00770 [Nanoarchaeota archaeon]|nr:hypothetical protein [Nanoarchaeota archaeon]